MGDHLVLFMNRLLTESTLEAAIESENMLKQPMPSPTRDVMISSFSIDVDSGTVPSNYVECRICHDGDEESNMETPCSCCGTLKYAHRKCVQRWCNEKGDTICEICHQQFKPDYTAPSPLFHYGGIPLNLRGNWEISRRDLNNPLYIPTVTTDQEYLNTVFDEYSAPSHGSLICCRIIAVIFMILLVLRHTLPIVITGAGEYSLTLIMLLILRTIGILLPVYIMVRTFTSFQRRRHRQDPEFSVSSSDEENDLELTYHRSRFIHVR